MFFENRPVEYCLSKDDTLMLKGIAICLMLCHHLFTCVPKAVNVEFGECTVSFGVLGKVCVAIFVLLSGYGLAVQYGKIAQDKMFASFGENVRFLLKRLTKFYLNYWVIFLLFMPIVMWADESALSRYGGCNVYKMLFKDFLGVNGLMSYNRTWWFNKLILTFYIVFPLYYALMKNKFTAVFMLVAIFILTEINILGGGGRGQSLFNSVRIRHLLGAKPYACFQCVE